MTTTLPKGCNFSHFCLAVLRARGTGHTACFRLPGSTRSSFLCGKPCVMGMIIWTPLMEAGAISTASSVENLCGGILFSKGQGCCCSLESVFLSPAAVRLGHVPYPRHCLAVLLSPGTAQNACRLSSCSRSSLLCTRHLCVGHDLLERSPGCTAAQLQNGIFFVCALLLCTICYKYQTSP